MKWIVAVITLIGIALAGVSIKAGSDVSGWQDRENSAFAGVAAIVVFALDGVLIAGWVIWRMFTT